MKKTYFGLTHEQWHEARKEMRTILIKRVMRNATIYYSELSQKLAHIANIEPHSYAMANLLGEISVDEYYSGRPLLSSVAILKSDNIPGGGFFSLAEQLGITVGEKVEFWLKEFNDCYEYWQNNPMPNTQHLNPKGLNNEPTSLL